MPFPICCSRKMSEIHSSWSLPVIVPMIFHAEDRERKEDRRDDRDRERHETVGRHGVAAERVVARREVRDQRRRQHPADARKERRARGQLVARVRVGTQRRHHAPVGDVVHRVGDAVEEVHRAEEPHELPALQLHVERRVDDERGRENADHEPGLKLAPARARPLDDVSHHGVVQRVENARRHHDRRDGRELRRVQISREEHERQQIASDQIVDHVAPNGAEREHDQIPFLDLRVVHGIISHRWFDCTKLFPRMQASVMMVILCLNC